MRGKNKHKILFVKVINSIKNNKIFIGYIGPYVCMYVAYACTYVDYVLIYLLPFFFFLNVRFVEVKWRNQPLDVN